MIRTTEGEVLMSKKASGAGPKFLPRPIIVKQSRNGRGILMNEFSLEFLRKQREGKLKYLGNERNKENDGKEKTFLAFDIDGRCLKFRGKALISRWKKPQTENAEKQGKPNLFYRWRPKLGQKSSLNHAQR